ncbi:MAG: hypothetical protein IKN98_05125 [Bacteroidales bacterium]|nr:hypothetical protein [Bacteroidales bacterium]
MKAKILGEFFLRREIIIVLFFRVWESRLKISEVVSQIAALGMFPYNVNDSEWTVKIMDWEQKAFSIGHIKEQECWL